LLPSDWKLSNWRLRRFDHFDASKASRAQARGYKTVIAMR